MQLTVISSTFAIDGVHGITLDGDGDRQAGSNYVAYLDVAMGRRRVVTCIHRRAMSYPK